DYYCDSWDSIGTHVF
nr:immunoglobulin light chain junction region [Macaca mulatta]